MGITTEENNKIQYTGRTSLLLRELQRMKLQYVLNEYEFGESDMPISSSFMGIIIRFLETLIALFVTGVLEYTVRSVVEKRKRPKIPGRQIISVKISFVRISPGPERRRHYKNK